MATDYAILEQELTDLKKELKRDLHMHQLKKLKTKQENLAKAVVQRKQIENLIKQIAELEPTVSTRFCPQHSLKDSEITGYLVYLLKMKDFFTREVSTKQEMINQEESQIKLLSKKLGEVMNEQAMLNRKIPDKSPGYILLENMSSRLHQINQRFSIMKQENMELVETITNMKKFQCQFKVFEKDFRTKINYLKEKSLQILEKAVSAYEEKDAFTNKKKMFKKRCALDQRKIAINEIALDMCQRKAESNRAFFELQGEQRGDVRMKTTTDKIKKGITDLGPNLEENQQLQSAIHAAAGKDTLEKMEEGFKLADDKIRKTLSYLNVLLGNIQELKSEADNIRKDNSDMIKNVSESCLNLIEEVEIKEDIAEKEKEVANETADITEKARTETVLMFDMVESLYRKCCPVGEKLLEQKPVDDSNVIDYVQDMENQLLDYLICLVYIRLKEVSDEDQLLILGSEKDEDGDDEVFKAEEKYITQPRILLSENERQSHLELGTIKTVLEFEELKKKAATSLSETVE